MDLRGPSARICSPVEYFRAWQAQAQQVARMFTEGAVAAEFREAYYVVPTIRVDRGIVTLRPLVTDGAMSPADTDAEVAALYAALASPAVDSATNSRGRLNSRWATVSTASTSVSAADQK